MQTTVQMETTVLPGHRVEVTDPQLPEGAKVQVIVVLPEKKVGLVSHLSPAELRELPREKRQAILAAAAELAEEDYRSDKELTGFDAFSEEELDDDETR